MFHRTGMAVRFFQMGGSTPDFLGHGKKSISVNLKSKEGVKIFKRLMDRSDVLLDPFRKGVMEKLHLGPADLMETNKRLIYARLTGFGQTGPYSNMAGHDINFLSLSGLLSLFGRYHEKPTPPANIVADFGGGGLMCAFGIILALFERTKSNTGQVIDSSMVDGSAYLGSWFFRSAKTPGLWGNPRGKNILDTGSHFYDTYQTKDGQYMSVGALEPQFYATFLEKLGLSQDELPHFDNFEENRSKLEEIFKGKTQAEWCKIFDGSDACVTPVLNLPNVTDHIHNKERNTFAISEDGTILPNPAPRLSRTPAVSVGTKLNPMPGENTTEILQELNYTSEEISDFISTGVVHLERRKSNL